MMHNNSWGWSKWLIPIVVVLIVVFLLKGKGKSKIIGTSNNSGLRLSPKTAFVYN